jgi:hypothetical protein
VVAFENLLAAFREAAHGKRRGPDVQAFHLDLEPNLLAIRRELLAGNYVFGPYLRFAICDPKRREILAAPFRDRVVHHALVRVVEPVFDPTLIADTYACRAGKGTLAAMKRLRGFIREVPGGYALKMDVRRYFPSIERERLLALLARKLKDDRLMEVLVRLIRDAPLPQGGPPGRGIPIGNLTSQLYANLYLSPVDHFLKEALREPRYLRYVDDLLVLGTNKARLWRVKDEVAAIMAGLGLELHPRKITVAPVADGVDFVGYRVFPDGARIRGANVLRFRRRLVRLNAALAQGTIDAATYEQQVSGWVGHAVHARSRGLLAALGVG